MKKPLLLKLAVFMIFTGALNAQVWTQKANCLFANDARAMFEIGGKVYSAGGLSSMDLDMYDPAVNTWTYQSTIPGVENERAWPVALALNGKAYVGLGNDALSTDGLKGDWWEYDPSNNLWTQKQNFPGVDRDGCVAFVANGKIYVGGGTDDSFVLNDFYEYDPVGDSWTQKNNLPAPNIFSTCFTINNKGYMACGYTGTQSNLLYEYDHINDSWIPKAAFPGAPRQTAVAFVLGTDAYVGFGMSNYTTVFYDVYKYSSTSNSWTPVVNTLVSGRAWSAATSVNGKGYIGTGLTSFSPFQFTASFYEFVPSSVGIDEVTDNSGVVVYPNPSSGDINITITAFKDEINTISITDITGRNVLFFQEMYVGHLNTISPDLPNGTYILNISNSKTSFNKKISIIKN